MDFSLSPEDEDFRQEVRDFLRKELPPDWNPGGFYGDIDCDTDEEWAFARHMRRKLAEKNWLGLTWPKEYGGLGKTHVQQLVLAEEMHYFRSPGFDIWGAGMLADTLLALGSDEQKKTILPPIGRAETCWFQAFTEPEAGSDLASLKTSAVEKDGNLIVNGQKVFITNAHRADYCFGLVRTDPDAPKHKGISFVLFDMKTPGITVSLLKNPLGMVEFCEVFFDNVVIPSGNIVGGKNNGWAAAGATLNVERTVAAMTMISTAEAMRDQIVSYVRDTKRGGWPLCQDAVVRHKLADLAVGIEVGRLMCYRAGWMLDQHADIRNEAAYAKLYSSEIAQHVGNVAMEVMGLEGQLMRGSKYARFNGGVSLEYVLHIHFSISGGTSEVERIIIARGLGLPR